MRFWCPTNEVCNYSRPDKYMVQITFKRNYVRIIILPKMIVEDEGDMVANWVGDEVDTPIAVSQERQENFQLLLQRYAYMRDQDTHHCLQANLVEHI